MSGYYEGNCPNCEAVITFGPGEDEVRCESCGEHVSAGEVDGEPILPDEPDPDRAHDAFGY